MSIYMQLYNHTNLKSCCIHRKELHEVTSTLHQLVHVCALHQAGEVHPEGILTKNLLLEPNFCGCNNKHFNKTTLYSEDCDN